MSEQELSIEKKLMEQREMQIVESQRITEVERRITYVEAKHGVLETTVGKMADVVQDLSKKTILNDAAIIAIRERTDDHNRNMERMQEEHAKSMEKLQSEQVEIGKKVVEVDGKIMAIRWVMGIAGSVGIVILSLYLGHFIK